MILAVVCSAYRAYLSTWSILTVLTWDREIFAWSNFKDLNPRLSALVLRLSP